MNSEAINFETVTLHKEIDLLQSCITRMANNSFYLKGWYISLITLATTLLFGQGCRIEIIGLFLLIVTSVFWGLDGFFLKLETLYRWKYEWIIQERLNDNYKYLYNLDPYNKEMWINPNNKNDCAFKFIFSKTLVPMYGVVWALSIVIIIFNIIF